MNTIDSPSVDELLGGPTVTFSPLKPADRSDATASGSVQGLVRLVKGVQDLVLDYHSYNVCQAKLITDGWTVYEDIREATLNPPTAAY